MIKYYENNDTPQFFNKLKPEICDTIKKSTNAARIGQLSKESANAFTTCINRLKKYSVFTNNAQQHIDILKLLFKFYLIANITAFQNTDQIGMVIMLLARLDDIPKNYLNKEFVSKSLELFEAFTPSYKIGLLIIHIRFNLKLPKLNEHSYKTVINYVYDETSSDEFTKNELLKVFIGLSGKRRFKSELVKMTAYCLVENFNISFANVVIRELGLSKRSLNKAIFELQKDKPNAVQLCFSDEEPDERPSRIPTSVEVFELNNSMKLRDKLKSLQREEISSENLVYCHEGSDIRPDPDLPSG